MPSVDINDMGSLGLIRDQAPHQLPPEAWTLALNMRIVDDAIERFVGKSQVFGNPGTSPIFAMYVSSSASIYWLYHSTDQSFHVWDGSTHSGLGSFTSAGAAKDLNGTILGGIPIINNGLDIPKFWALPYSVATPMANLTNWPSTLRCRVLRAFGPFLLALNVTESGTNKPHKFRWSHPASPGALPSTWDIADTTKDAGELELPDVESGIILDGLPLQGRFYIYKENSCWRLRQVKGRFIFEEDPFLETIGLLATRCVAVTADGNGHVLAGQDNLWMHDGNRAIPLLDRKMRRAVYNTFSPENISKAFLFTNARREETWFCYPELGSTVVNKVLRVQQKPPFQCTEGEIDFVHAANGVVETADTLQWNQDTLTWEQDPNAWSTTTGGRRVVVSNQVGSKFQLLDSGTDNDGVAITGTLQRSGLAVIGRKRNGEWITDFQRRKMCTRVWPKVSGAAITVRVGSHNVPDGAVTWSAEMPFDPATQRYVDVVVEGPALAVEFKGSGLWRLDGYKLDVELTGKF